MCSSVQYYCFIEDGRDDYLKQGQCRSLMWTWRYAVTEYKFPSLANCFLWSLLKLMMHVCSSLFSSSFKCSCLFVCLFVLIFWHQLLFLWVQISRRCSTGHLFSSSSMPHSHSAITTKLILSWTSCVWIGQHTVRTLFINLKAKINLDTTFSIRTWKLWLCYKNKRGLARR